MPSAPGSLDGLFTRISASALSEQIPEQVREQSRVLQATQIDGLWIEQVRVQFDQAKWQQHFLSEWPEGSAAHTSYFKRISQGI